VATLLAGWGYWYRSNYPNGFRRPRADMVVEVVEVRGINVWVKLPSGEVVETRADAVEVTAAPVAAAS
jgi:hypothetical protein